MFYWCVQRDSFGQWGGFFSKTNGTTAKSPCSTHVDPRYPLRTRSQLHLLGLTSVTIQNVFVFGASQHTGPHGVYERSLEAQHAWQIDSCSDLTLRNITAGNTWGDNVYISGKTGIVVEDAFLQGASRNVLSIVSGSNVLFTNSQLVNARMALIDLEANSESAMLVNISFSRDVFGAARFETFANLGANCVVDSISMVNNTMIHGVPFKFIVKGPSLSNATHQRHGYVLIDNDFGVGNGNEALVHVQHVQNVIVSGNRASGFTGKPWPHRGGRPQAPVEANCVDGLKVQGNAFTTLPPNMTDFVSYCS